MLKYTFSVKKQNLFYFVHPQPTSPKQLRVKNKTSLNFFSTIGLILKTLNKLYEKIFYSVGFTKPTL